MTEPMYRQIAEDLRGRIEAGVIARGAQLPTEIELREEFDASRNTVRDAVKWLINRGLVETRPGQGTFVTERITPFVTTLTGDPGSGDSVVYEAAVRAERRAPRTTAPRVEVQEATGQIAAGLGVSAGSSVISRHVRCFIDETPWALQTSFYPMDFVAQGATQLLQATDIEGGAVAYLAEKFAIKQAGYRDQIKVRAPEDTEATFFKIPEDGRVSVLAILRTAFDTKGKTIRLTITVYPTDRNQFAVNVGTVPPVSSIPS